MISAYQDTAIAHLRKVLDKHGLLETTFEKATDGQEQFVATFLCNGRQHEIEIYQDSGVMLSGKRLFEIYLKDEFGSPEVEISSFASRLDRYLEGSEW